MFRSARRAAVIIAIATASGAPAVAATAATSASNSTTAHVTPDTYGTFNTSVWANYVNIRSGPGTGYSSNGQAQIGQTIVDYCYTTGTSVNGNIFWDRVHDANTGKNGYITEYYLNDRSQTLHC